MGENDYVEVMALDKFDPAVFFIDIHMNREREESTNYLISSLMESIRKENFVKTKQYLLKTEKLFREKHRTLRCFPWTWMQISFSNLDKHYDK